MRSALEGQGHAPAGGDPQMSLSYRGLVLIIALLGCVLFWAHTMRWLGLW
jgi:hypothetical protein